MCALRGEFATRPSRFPPYDAAASKPSRATTARYEGPPGLKRVIQGKGISVVDLLDYWRFPCKVTGANPRYCLSNALEGVLIIGRGASTAFRKAMPRRGGSMEGTCVPEAPRQRQLVVRQCPKVRARSGRFCVLTRTWSKAACAASKVSPDKSIRRALSYLLPNAHPLSTAANCLGVLEPSKHLIFCDIGLAAAALCDRSIDAAAASTVTGLCSGKVGTVSRSDWALSRLWALSQRSYYYWALVGHQDEAADRPGCGSSNAGPSRQ